MKELDIMGMLKGRTSHQEKTKDPFNFHPVPHETVYLQRLFQGDLMKEENEILLQLQQT
jgi:hypothetical protein